MGAWPMSALAYDFDQHGHLLSPAPRSDRPQTVREAAERRAPLPAPLARPPRPSDLRLDRTRDALLTPFGKATLQDRCLMPGEDFQDMFARVSCRPGRL